MLQKIGKIASATNGATDVYVEEVSGLPQIVVNFKRDKIAQYGLSMAAINQVIRAGFAGDVAGEVFEGEKRFDLVVRLDKENAPGHRRPAGLVYHRTQWQPGTPGTTGRCGNEDWAQPGAAGRCQAPYYRRVQCTRAGM